MAAATAAIVVESIAMGAMEGEAMAVGKVMVVEAMVVGAMAAEAMVAEAMVAKATEVGFIPDRHCSFLAR